MNRMREYDSLWSIILAGGEGNRLRTLVQRWLGHHKPKQYCTFVGTRFMLQHTLDRADQLSAPERKVTVIARSHRWAAWPQTERATGEGGSTASQAGYGGRDLSRTESYPSL